MKSTLFRSYICFALFLIAISGSVTPAYATEQACDAHQFHITHAQIRATPPNAPVTGGYLQIDNIGANQDRLIAAEASFSDHVELHEMQHNNGVMKMAPLAEGILIKSGESVHLQPGGLHIMFMHLNQQIKDKGEYRAILVFEKCGRLPVLFQATKSPESGQKKHSHKMH
jgi:copper(I)-binding protein